MKKLILLIVLILSFVGVNAQETKGNCIKVCYAYTGYSFSDWKNVNIPITVDFQRKKITIYSQKTQIIDYVGFSIEKTNEYTIMRSQATDTNYQTINVKLLTYNDNTDYLYLSIEYSDVQYMYLIE